MGWLRRLNAPTDPLARVRRGWSDRCLRCGYDLRGVRGRAPACPECGLDVEVAGSTDRVREPWRTVAVVAGCLHVAAALAGVFVGSLMDLSGTGGGVMSRRVAAVIVPSVAWGVMACVGLCRASFTRLRSPRHERDLIVGALFPLWSVVVLFRRYDPEGHSPRRN